MVFVWLTHTDDRTCNTRTAVTAKLQVALYITTTITACSPSSVTLHIPV